MEKLLLATDLIAKSRSMSNVVPGVKSAMFGAKGGKCVEITSDTKICILDSKYGIIIAIILALMCIFAALVFKSTKKIDFYNKVSTRNLL